MTVVMLCVVFKYCLCRLWVAGVLVLKAKWRSVCFELNIYG